MNILVTGGVRSGKSHHAETLVADLDDVTYVATGPDEAAEPDPDWAERLRLHRTRRPAHWGLEETLAVGKVLDAHPGAVLIDCLGTWVTRLIDARALWDAPGAEVHAMVETETDSLVAALRRRPASAGPVVVVTNEVGLGVIPSHRSGALFRDLLGTVNRRVAQECAEVHLVVAGRVLKL
ncbi:MAG: bifunctional adenosylcobinamide kinase/adenosylcobinamide-phosphate guanylyltransferase [Nocardioides sp.]|uniref:bifunctional adenosylcobinamide kinase/adenosylcobinamide-phosphate guanylyltransferase n=1 Tax=Nocardioides sp. TaxID=35761 RepID=UPI003F0BFB5C